MQQPLDERGEASTVRQSLLALVRPLRNETFARLGVGLGVSEATAWHYADRAPTGLGEGDVVIVDGILIPNGRVAADEPYGHERWRSCRTRRDR
ncbi:hypothetical protein F0L17_25825 [Streptomyces sp. TRM43335]|uniref:Transposase n=1 Tax=Streptomyces taklimakanensis TaxID=2569853 RepID=A0A6G2BJJ7_9ACTN|nr:hypothetical protein [Streptomyces taklimakanensis]